MISSPLNPTERDRLKRLSAFNLLSANDADLARLLRCLVAAMNASAAAVIVAARHELSVASSVNWKIPDHLHRQALFAELLEDRSDDAFECMPSHPDWPRCAELTTLHGLGRFVAVPLHAGSTPVALLCLSSSADQPMNESERALLADFRAVFDRDFQLRQDATRDHLTGLLNRRYAENFIERETRRAYRERLPIAFIMIDLDHFKAFNDRYGHAAGDEALRQTAFAISSCCRRPADLAARLGGEEFLIVLPNTDLDGTKRLIERVMEAVEALEIEHEDSSTGKMTFSAGAVVGTSSELSMPFDQIIRQADEMLYEAKHAGRNGYRVRALQA
jgi:diguanylate cyclase (GGDEF)-like protein